MKRRHGTSAQLRQAHFRSNPIEIGHALGDFRKRLVPVVLVLNRKDQLDPLAMDFLRNRLHVRLAGSPGWICYRDGPSDRQTTVKRTMTRTKHHFAGLFAAIVTAWATFTLITEQATAQKPAKIAVPENIIYEPNIEYSNPDGQHLQLDMARPKTADGPFPAIACIHGGGFRAGARQGYDGLCIRLAQQGYVAVTVSYRLAPKYQFPAAIHDVKAAIRWLRANAEEIPD